MYDYFAYFGMITAGVLASILVGGTIILGGAWVLVNFPRFHFGAPKNPCEWHCFDAREILTTKNGTIKEPTGRGHLVQTLGIRWWIGLSSRNRAKWFFGILRTDPRVEKR